jgi:hypothetical protein
MSQIWPLMMVKLHLIYKVFLKAKQIVPPLVQYVGRYLLTQWRPGLWQVR